MATAVRADEERVLAGVPAGSLVGGQLGPESGGHLDVEDPATGTTLLSLPTANSRTAVDALEAACEAQADWAATTMGHRRDFLHRAFDAVTAEAEDLALLITLEMGKPLPESLAEVRYAAAFLRWYSEEAARIGGRYSDHVEGLGRILTRKHPVGPCLLITPWNFPLAMATRKVAPALAAGCTAILKPAEQTPLTSLRFAAILQRCGLPPGVLNVVITDRPHEMTAAILADGRLRKLSFTGSTGVGRSLLAECAPGVLRCSMELGGNAPLLVFEDADLDLAVDGALVAKLRNGGESCTAANRVYVQDSIAAAFVARFTERVSALRIGRGTEDVDVGPMIDSVARDRLHDLVRDAVDNGATAVAGGKPYEGPGYFFLPTILTDVPIETRMLDQEIFGPVAPIIEFSEEDEAIAAANRTAYGLVAYVFTGGLDRALRVSDRLDTGMVGINQGLVANASAPFGGIKESGLGREGGAEGLDEYQTIKYVAMAGTPASVAMRLGADEG
jgi:succinate-semialdehyde dehydrogenase/glutarate-semialdehyde dehydrogenase